eukprot:TRINITY_DN10457_c0_g2_i4.p1 TRINITY_DN10457_c0_g2~~TRINITY_DN10457_c0_g2_i4.p1  ORF type:complete len:219 (+),score=51.43 TRINITY_DN10457_c0_g2_i4:882-1538(+)
MGGKVRNHNIEKIFMEKRKDDSAILPTKVFQDQLEGNYITVVEFANTLDMARYIRTGIMIAGQKQELIQLGMAMQRIKELKSQEDIKNKQITISRTNVNRNMVRVEIDEEKNKEVISAVKDNTKALGDLWSAVANLNQAQSEHWQYSIMQGDMNTMLQLKTHLESNLTDVKSKMRMLEMDKKFAKMEGDMEQKEIKEKLNKQKEKWKSLVQELTRTLR